MSIAIVSTRKFYIVEKTRARIAAGVLWIIGILPEVMLAS